MPNAETKLNQLWNKRFFYRGGQSERPLGDHKSQKNDQTPAGTSIVARRGSVAAIPVGHREKKKHSRGKRDGSAFSCKKHGKPAKQKQGFGVWGKV